MAGYFPAGGQSKCRRVFDNHSHVAPFRQQAIIDLSARNRLNSHLVNSAEAIREIIRQRKKAHIYCPGQTLCRNLSHKTTVATLSYSRQLTLQKSERFPFWETLAF
ncbi:hypothetical protein [Qipengyuania sp. NPDC077563]|uniref:hypothetical protein n=1 Tax=Qipengyuania sp. NPDC077563 TaxID=3364497 RepID=UPI00384C3FCF